MTETELASETLFVLTEMRWWEMFKICVKLILYVFNNVVQLKTPIAAYYSGVKFLNKLPSNIKNVRDNINKFKITLKKFLCMNSFYTLDEYFEQ
jgi:hypothetical protein